MTRRLVGAVASCLALLAGLWLILSPFALGIQPKNTDWKHETVTDVWSGIGLAVLGLIGVIVFAAALIQHLAERGLVTPRPVKAASAAVEAAPAAPSTSAAATQSTDLDKLLSPLVAALARDLNRDQVADAQQPTHHANGEAAASYPNSVTPETSDQPKETLR